MDEILEKYSASKFEECLNLLEIEIQNDDNLAENFIKQNCIEVCKCLVLIYRGDSSKIVDTLRTLYKRYQNSIAVGLPYVFIPIQVEMTYLFNFVWWGLFYVNLNNNEDIDRNVYLPIIQRGLRRVLGIPCTFNENVIIEELLYDIRNAGKNSRIKDYQTLGLMEEVIVLILLYVLKANSSTNVVVQCLETVTTIIDDMENLLPGLKAVRDFNEPCPLYRKLFKFGFVKINSTVSKVSATVTGYLHMIKSLCFLLLKKHENVLLVMKQNLKPALKPLQYYICGLSALMLGEYEKCSGFVMMSDDSTDRRLKSRLNILHGQVLSKKEKYKEALKCFSEAKSLSPNTAAASYYMGEEYGKIGLIDDMVNCFKDVIKVIKESKFEKVNPFATTVESVILDLIHPGDEITESEGTYAAAVACGLTERYEESVELFERYIDIKCREREGRFTGDRIIKTPGIVTVFHEAATMHIMMGNFARASHILSQAASHYTKSENPLEQPEKDVHVTKDVNWLRNLLREELGLTATQNGEKNDSVELFTEEMVSLFEEDMIALMLSGEIEKVVDQEKYTETLGKTTVVFTRYISEMRKKETMGDVGRLQWTLVKALSAKTSLNIAVEQIKRKTTAFEIERSFKRGLSCNRGDKDVLHGYCQFLMSGGRTQDAHKVWNDFRGKEPSVVADQCQSLALRYLLRTRVSEAELEKIEMSLQLSAMEIDSRV